MKYSKTVNACFILQIKEGLQKQAESVCGKIADSLRQYLSSDEVKTALLTWSDTEAPDYKEDIEKTQLEGNMF